MTMTTVRDLRRRPRRWPTREPPGSERADHDAALPLAARGARRRCRSSSPSTSTLPVVRPLLALGTLLGAADARALPQGALPRDSSVAKGIYAFGSSLLGVILVGLLVNTVLPLVGVDRPLQPLVLAITWFLIDAGSAAVAAARPLVVPVADLGCAPAAATRGSRPRRRSASAVVVAGRARRGAAEQRRRGGVALLAHVLAAAALVALMLPRDGTLGRDARVLAAGRREPAARDLAARLGHHRPRRPGRVLRVQAHRHDQHWSMGAAPERLQRLPQREHPADGARADARACPASPSSRSCCSWCSRWCRCSPTCSSRRFLDRRLALAAATFTMAFPTFFTDMPYLVRQEIAFFFLALLLLAATEPGERRRNGSPAGRVLRRRRGALALLDDLPDDARPRRRAGRLLGLAALGRGSAARGADTEHGPLVLLSPVIVAFLAVASLMWAGPATHTGGHAGDVAQRHDRGDLRPGRGRPGSSDVSYCLFSRDEVSPRERLDLFVDQTLDAREAGPGGASARQASRAPPSSSPRSSRPARCPSPRRAGRRRRRHRPVDRLRHGRTARLRRAHPAVPARRRGRDARRAPARRDRKLAARGCSPELACVVLGALAALGLVVAGAEPVRRVRRPARLPADAAVRRAGDGGGHVDAAQAVRQAGGRAGGGRARRRCCSILTGVLPALLGGNPARLALANSGSTTTATSPRTPT